MIFSLEKRVVLFTPPKCAANTLHEVLCRDGCKCVIGPQFDGGTDIHTTSMPWEVWDRPDEFTFAVSVRNPFTRAASLFGHYKGYWPKPHLRFEEFLEQFVVAPRFTFFNATIASFLRSVEAPLDGRRRIAVTACVRVESLVADLARLGFEVPGQLPVRHRSENAGMAEHSQRSKSLVELWAYHDFERFGYARRIPGLD
jgi:hypothetical protein